MSSKSYRFAFVLSVLLTVCGIWLFNNDKAQAATNTYPNQADFSFATRFNNTVPTGHDVFVDISLNLTGGLNAPSGVVGVYMDNNTDSINIESANGNCAGDNPNRRANYRLWYWDGSIFRASGAPIDSDAVGCNLSIPPNPNTKTDYVGNVSYYLYFLEYYSVGGSSSDVNAFKVNVASPGSKVSTLRASGPDASKFSLQDRAGTGASCDPSVNNECRRTTFKLNFGTDCKVSSGSEQQQIRWFDDDGDDPTTDEGFPPPGNADITLESTHPSGQRGISMRLYDETAGVEVPITTPNGHGNIAKFGPSEDGITNPITFHANHKYRLEWEAVSRSNGIQFQLPYDGIFHDVSCQSVRGGVTTGNCNAISGWAIDDSSPSSSLQVDIYTAGYGVTNITGIASTPSGKGYWLAGADGGVFSFGDAGFFGGLGGVPLAKPIVDIERTPSGNGYWLVGADGGIFAFGDAGFHGSSGQVNPALPPGGANSFVVNNIIGIASTPTGNGYWLTGADGGVFAFNAPFHGSSGRVNPALPPGGANSFTPVQPIVGMASTPTGNGYWMAGADGGVFSFGGAVNYGNLVGSPLTQPIVDIQSSKSGNGYWMVSGDGGVFAFGDAPFLGGGGQNTIVGLAINNVAGTGYWTAGSDGRAVPYGDAKFHGALKETIVGTVFTPGGGGNNWSYGNFAAISSLVGKNVVRFNAYAHRPGVPAVLLSGSPVPVGPCAGDGSTGECIVTVSPTEPEINTNPTFNMSVGYFGSSPGGTMSLSFTPSGGSPGSVNNIIPAPDPSGTHLVASYNSKTFGTTGSYNVRLDYAGAFSTTCQANFEVVAKPYARFYGGDVRTGAAPICDGWTFTSIPADADIDGHYSPTTNKGMGSQLAAFAAGRIDGFASANTRTTLPFPAKGLSFSNEAGDPTYGGNFSERFCPPDYFSKKPTSGTLNPGTSLNLSSMNGHSSPDGNYEFVGSGNVSLKQRLPVDRRVALYVEGNVFVESTPPEVNLDSVGAGGTVANLPSLYVIVKGNIFLDDGDRDIGGVFIAQPDDANPDTGKIYTCSNGFAPPTNIKNECNNKLTVSGALIARQIKFFRSNSSLSAGTAREGSGSASIAEAIILSPDIWLAPVPNSLRNDVGEFDAITSLPPIL